MAVYSFFKNAIDLVYHLKSLDILLNILFFENSGII